MNNPYMIYIDDLEVPVTPAEITEKRASKNDFYKLLNGNTYTAIRKPDLANWAFSFYVLSKPHPQIQSNIDQDTVRQKLKSLKDEKKVFEFIVLRSNSDIRLKNSICKYMTLEDYSINENADFGTNIKITVELKEYEPLLTVKLQSSNNSRETNEVYEVMETGSDYGTVEVVPHTELIKV